MEALLIILAELLYVAIYPALAVIGAFVVTILEAVFWFAVGLFGWVFGAKIEKPEPHDPAQVKPKRKSRYLHWLMVPFALAGGAVLIVNFFFFEPTLRYALNQIEKRTPYDLQFAKANGNLLTGQLTLQGFEVSRPFEAETGIKASIESFEIDVKPWTLLGRSVEIETLSVSGVTGKIQLPPKREKRTRNPDKVRRTFTVDDLALTNVDFTLMTADQKAHQLQIAQASSQPFRSRMAVFDLFFRSNLDATVDGIPLVVQTKVLSERGRRTEWAFRDVPVATAAALVDRAPFTWLNGGTVSAVVQDEWDLKDDYIDMDWQIDLKGTEVAAPPDAGQIERLVISALDRAVDKQGGDANLGFQMRIDQDGLKNAATGDMTIFWDAFKKGATKAIADTLGEKVEDTENRLNSAGNRMRSIFQREE